MSSLMRYGIFSDVHSNLEALEAVIEAYKRESIDCYLCVGDVVGYAANPKECIDKIKALAQVTVAGNHDWAVADLCPIDYFNPVARQAISWTKGNLDYNYKHFLESLKLIYRNQDLTLVHSTLDSPENFDYILDTYTAKESFELMETKICFIGHSHVSGIFIEDKNGRISYRENNTGDIKGENRYIVNVGSVGQPRDDNPHAAYCVYDSDKKEIWIKRIGYDIETARRKIIAARLPAFLGDRLIAGR